MVRVFLVPGTHVVKVRVEANGHGCDCAVLANQGVALIFSPPINEIRRELRDNGQTILRDVHRLIPQVKSLSMCDQS